ncbi:unnamed protein product [Paramecium octaurelia]|uniref:Uncharacterized protein n=1 Tax=Paramecium octaurelia TaxID=43137 RepID=A0A8S1SMX2_PAROT|nr:unnamed protein product [Paramecium octaurelia]
MRRPNEVEYGKTALMANWYEDRLAPQQLQRDPNAQKSLRTVEEGISIPGDNGCLLPLPRVNRNPPYITKEIIVPDDGYREFRTEFQTKFDAKNIQNMQLGDCRALVKTNGEKVNFPECNPTVAQTAGARSIKQLDQTNMQQILVDRAVHQNYTDFGSTFRNHPEQHNKFYSITTYQQSFQPPENNVKEVLTDKKVKPLAAGCRERDPFDQGLKMTSVITGEKYRDSVDPKENTEVQRQWVHCGDSGLKTAQNNLRSSSIQNYKKTAYQVHPYDIATSLPMGDGVYTLHSKYTDPGQFRHIRSDVTRIMNKPITRK